MGLRHPGRRAGLEHRPQRRAHGGLAGLGLRHDGRPPVRLVDADELQRRRRGLVGSARPRHLGRRRDDVARPDGLEPRLDVRSRHRPLRHRDAGHLGRGDREAVEALARGARSVLLRVARARRARARRGPLRQGDHPDRRRRAGRRRRRRDGDADADALRGRRGDSRDDAREDGAAAARVHPGRRRHRGQLVADRRRLGRRADRVRAEGVGARPRAARALPRLRHRRRRPAPDAARQSRRVRARAREGGPRSGTTST